MALRLSELRRLVVEEFGTVRGEALLSQLSLSDLGSRTAEAALADGVAPAAVWAAICAQMEVPPERRLGRDRPIKRS